MYRYTHVYLHTHMQSENKRDRLIDGMGWGGVGGGGEEGEKRGAARQTETKACERTNRRKPQQK